MADFSESNSLAPEKLVDLRGLLAKPSSSAINRSQTVPNKVGRTKAEEQPFESLKPVSRSYTMPILGEGADVDIDIRPLMSLSQRKTVQDYKVKEVDLGTNHSSPLYPLRRSLSVPRSNRLKKAPPGRRVLILWIVSGIIFLIIPPLVSSLLGGLLHSPDFNYASNNTQLDRNVDMILSLVSADPLTSVATFDWLLDFDTDAYNDFCPDLTNCTDVSIFIDSNLLDESANNLGQSTDIPTVPIFRINANNWINSDFRASSAIFRTNIRLFSRGFTSQSSIVRYPFDVYSATISMFAQDATNQTVGLNVVGSTGNAVGFTTSAVDCAVDQPGFEVPDGMLCFDITIKRGVLVRAFCIIATIAVWLITMAELLLTLTSIIFGFRQRVEVLVVPVATIFAFTQLRSSMPGAPAGFGDVLDFAALLPCLGILALSAAISLGAFILVDPEKKAEVLTWRRLRTQLFHAHKGEPTSTEEEGDETESEDSAEV